MTLVTWWQEKKIIIDKHKQSNLYASSISKQSVLAQRGQSKWLRWRLRKTVKQAVLINHKLLLKCAVTLLTIVFFSFLGIVKHQLSTSFHKTIEQHANKCDSENIVWGPNYQTPSTDGIKFPHRNGYKRHIIVNLYSSEDGHAKFNQLLRQGIHSDKNTDSERITIEYIDEELRKICGNLPEPDLGVFFGSYCCSSGFMPWHIRLTEFIPISHKLHNLSLEKYLKVLYKYARCEQRFGKWVFDNYANQMYN